MKKTVLSLAIGILVGAMMFSADKPSAEERTYTYDEVQQILQESYDREYAIYRRMLQYEMGDMNNDGHLDADDVLILLQNINYNMIGTDGVG